MGFKFYRSYYDYIVATKIRKQLGHKWIYRVRFNKQEKFPYYKPDNPRTYYQQAIRSKIRHAVWSWQSLSENTKNYYRKLEPIRPIMSGYNFYISQYLKIYFPEVPKVNRRTYFEKKEHVSRSYAAGEEYEFGTINFKGELVEIIFKVTHKSIGLRIYLDGAALPDLLVGRLYEDVRLGLGTEATNYMKCIKYDDVGSIYIARFKCDSSYFETSLSLRGYNTDSSPHTSVMYCFAVVNRIV